MSDPNAATPGPAAVPGPTSPHEPHHPRRWRRRGWILLVAALVTGLVGFGIGRASARWHGHGFGFTHQIDADTAMRRAERGINRMLSAVDASAEQKTRVGEIVKAAIKDLMPLRDQVRATRDKLAAALKAEKIDRAAIEQLRTEQMALGETASKRAAQALTDAAEVLTPAQRAKLIDRWQRRLGRG